jgi:hypothetical protein
MLGIGIFTADGKVWLIYYKLFPFTNWQKLSICPRYLARPCKDTIIPHIYVGTDRINSGNILEQYFAQQFTRDHIADLELEERDIRTTLRHLQPDVAGWTSEVDLRHILFRLTLVTSTESSDEVYNHSTDPYLDKLRLLLSSTGRLLGIILMPARLYSPFVLDFIGSSGFITLAHVASLQETPQRGRQLGQNRT